MALGDGIRRNIASVDPVERRLLRDAFVELNRRYFPGKRTDKPPGGVSWWFKQDEIHQATHVHSGPEFLPWHREIVNRLEKMLREINPLLTLHYWDWTQNPRRIPNANLDNGRTGTLNLFDDLMGYGGETLAAIGKPWADAGFYDPTRDDDPKKPLFDQYRDDLADPDHNNPADPPLVVNRRVFGSPASTLDDDAILRADDYADMRLVLERVHGDMHNFVVMGGQHISFRDPFVFLLHSNVDRLFARWQTDPEHRQVSSGRFLDAGEESSSDFVVTRPAQTNDTQRWVMVPVPGRLDVVRFQQVSTGRFLDANEGGLFGYSAVTMPAQDNDSQHWDLSVPAPNTYSLRQKSSGRFLDAGEESNSDFVETRPAQNNTTQRWILNRVGDVYTIQHAVNNRFLDAHEVAEKKFGVVTRTAQNNDSQRWLVLPLSSDTFTLQQLNTRRFVDAHTSSSQDFSVFTVDPPLLWLDDTQRWVIRTTT